MVAFHRKFEWLGPWVLRRVGAGALGVGEQWGGLVAGASGDGMAAQGGVFVRGSTAGPRGLFLLAALTHATYQNKQYFQVWFAAEGV